MTPILAPDRRLWLPGRQAQPTRHRRRVAPWWRSLAPPVLNMATAGQRLLNASGQRILTPDGKQRNSDGTDTCDGEWAQWRQCGTGTLQNLWSPPFTSDPATGDALPYPIGMILRSNHTCYYRDGTEPVSASPGTIISQAIPPGWTGDFIVLPDGFSCSNYYCTFHDCDACGASDFVPRVIALKFSGITAPTGCSTCAGGGCMAAGTSLEPTGFDSAVCNRTYLCVRDGSTDPDYCSWTPWPYNGTYSGTRKIVYTETYYDWAGCGGKPDPGCGDPFDVWQDDLIDPFPSGVYFQVSVRETVGDQWAVGMSQGYFGGGAAWFFNGFADMAAADRCDLPASGSHDPQLGLGTNQSICFGQNRSSGGSVTITPLV